MPGVNDYTLDVILKAKEEGMAAFAAMNAKLAELVAAAELANHALERMDERGNQHSNILRMMSDDTLRTVHATERMADSLESKLTPSLRNVERAAGSGGGGGATGAIYAFLQGMIPGQQTAGNIVLAIAALSVALATLSGELAASLVLFGAWLVGMTAFMATVAIVVAPILAMAAAFGALAIAQMGGLDPVAQLDKAHKQLATAMDRTEAAQEAVRLAQLRYDAKPTAVNLQILKDAQEQLAETQQKQVAAQNAVNVATQNAAGPVSRLHEGLAALGQSLGQQAVPLVNQFATLLLAFLPTIDAAGHAMLNWFGGAFPLLMDLAQKAAFGLIDGLNRIAAAWVQVANDFLGHPVEFSKVFGSFFNLGVEAVIGLMKNLEALAFWFIDRFPVLEKNAESTFANLGIVIQAVGHGLGAFVDWVIANWPAINHTFNETWKVIQEGWNQVKPMFDLFAITLKALKPTIDDITSHLYLFKPLLELVAAAFLIVIGVIFLVMVVLIALGALLTALALALTDFVKTMIEWGSILGTTVKRVLDAFKPQFAEAGAEFSALGAAAQNASKDTGSAFDAIGTKVHEVVTKNSITIATGNDEQSKKIRDSNKLNQSVIEITWNAMYNAVAFWLNSQWLEVVRQWTAITTWLGNTWHSLWSGASFWWNAIWAAIAFWLNAQWQEVLRLWTTITSWLGSTWNSLWVTAGFWWGAIHNTVVGWLRTIQTTAAGIWSGIVGAASSAMSDLQGKIHEGIKGAAGVLEGFIKAVDSALYPVLHRDVIPHIDVAKLAEGGVIPGYAPGQDTVPALLSPGEGVIRPEMVRQMGGAATIDAINKGELGPGDWQKGAGINIPAAIGAIFGQCVPFVERALGVFWPVALAKQLTAYVNSQTARAGEAAVFTGGAAGHVALLTGSGDGYTWPVIDSNWVAANTVGTHIMSKGMYGFAGFIDTGAAGGGLSGLVNAVAGSAGAAVSGLVDAALNAAKSQISGLPDWIKDLPGPILDQLAGAVRDQLTALFAPGPASAAPGATTVGGSLGSWISQAIALTGVPASWAGSLSVLIGRESGGNPAAINRTDINAILGHPSQGLMQLIPSNFAAYHVAGTSSSILDPVANIAAGIRYILARYGSIFNVQQANAALPPRGYDSGGGLPPGLTAAWNGTGRTEPVLGPDSQDDIHSMRELLGAVLQELRIQNGASRLGGQTAGMRFAS